MKYKVPRGALIEIEGPDQTQWGTLKFKVYVNNRVVGHVRGQKSAQFFIENDTRFTVRATNSNFSHLEASFAGLSNKPALVKLHIIGSSMETVKLAAQVKYGQSYFKK